MIKRGGAGLKFDNDFFNTEVREGFEISSMMKRAWAAQMEVFQVVSDICNRNGIRYFADFGTLLGAVRHKGMIPWDDDIDISLMRDEYNELIRILPGELPYGFVVAGMYADCERLQNAAFVPQLRVIADEELLITALKRSLYPLSIFPYISRVHTDRPSDLFICSIAFIASSIPFSFMTRENTQNRNGSA